MDNNNAEVLELRQSFVSRIPETTAQEDMEGLVQAFVTYYEMFKQHEIDVLPRDFYVVNAYHGPLLCVRLDLMQLYFEKVGGQIDSKYTQPLHGDVEFTVYVMRNDRQYIGKAWLNDNKFRAAEGNWFHTNMPMLMTMNQALARAIREACRELRGLYVREEVTETRETDRNLEARQQIRGLGDKSLPKADKGLKLVNSVETMVAKA